MLTGVHHISFLVEDLDKAVERYKDLFEIESVELETSPESAASQQPGLT